MTYDTVFRLIVFVARYHYVDAVRQRTSAREGLQRPAAYYDDPAFCCFSEISHIAGQMEQQIIPFSDPPVFIARNYCFHCFPFCRPASMSLKLLFPPIAI